MQDFLKKIEDQENCKIGVFAEFFDSKNSKKIVFTEKDVFPAASIIKVFVAAAVLQKTEKENWNLSKELEIEKEEKNQKSSVLTETTLEKISLEDTLYFLLAHSDNLAQNILEKIISEEEINEFIQKQGFADTRFVSLKKSDDENFSTTTPKDSRIFLKNLFQGKILSKNSTDLILQKLSQTKDFSSGLRLLPCKLNVANPEIGTFYSKAGRLKNTANSCVLLKTKEGPIIICVFVTNLEIPEFRNGVDNKGALLVAKITKKAFDELGRK